MSDGPIKTRAIKRSTLVGILIFAVFGALLLRVLIIQTFGFDKYQSKVINQMTTESAVPANRGKIFDLKFFWEQNRQKLYSYGLFSKIMYNYTSFRIWNRKRSGI